MFVPATGAVARFFVRVLALRRWIAAAFALAAIAGLYGAMQVPDDASIDSLVVATDPVARATHDFERLFPEGEQALLLAEPRDPRSAEAVRGVQALASKLSAIGGVEAQAVAGPYLGVSLELHTRSPDDRDRALAAIDAALTPFVAAQGPFREVHRIGSPWVDAWLEHATAAAEQRVMPLFGLFLMALILMLYRSWRTLGAIVLTLAAVVCIAMGLAELAGWAHTLVSALVPLTVMITTTATLVYLHSRYIERDDAGSLTEHHARALANKLVPCTASMLATAVGFAALAVSDIRPIRDMGLWTASGLAVAWLGCFLLFPALQSLLNTPLKAERAPAGRWYPHFVDRWVPLTRRMRWPFIIATLLLTACGAIALFGIRGVIAPLSLQTDALAYIDPSVAVARDTREFEKRSGLAVLELWLQLPPGEPLSEAVIGATRSLARALERDPRISAVAGPGSASGQPPRAAAAPAPERYVVRQGGVTNIRISVRGRDTAFGPPGAMRAYVERTFDAVRSAEPALRGARGRVVGRGVLAEQISVQLVPTLIESFALTAGVIFCVFLLVFRSASARLMAMIPSVFAILAAFLVMRVSGMALNIATILIGSTVLGATENDQVHFFYHFQEGRRGIPPAGAVVAGREGAQPAGTAQALQHAFRVAGRPIAFATLINAAGFLALALSDLPPMREFGIVSASAFLLALAADFTALPAALWLLDRSGRAPRAAREPLSRGRPEG